MSDTSQTRNRSPNSVKRLLKHKARVRRENGLDSDIEQTDRLRESYLLGYLDLDSDDPVEQVKGFARPLPVPDEDDKNKPSDDGQAEVLAGHDSNSQNQGKTKPTKTTGKAAALIHEKMQTILKMTESVEAQVKLRGKTPERAYEYATKELDKVFQLGTQNSTGDDEDEEQEMDAIELDGDDSGNDNRASQDANQNSVVENNGNSDAATSDHNNGVAEDDDLQPTSRQHGSKQHIHETVPRRAGAEGAGLVPGRLTQDERLEIPRGGRRRRANPEAPTYLQPSIGQTTHGSPSRAIKRRRTDTEWSTAWDIS